MGEIETEAERLAAEAEAEVAALMAEMRGESSSSSSGDAEAPRTRKGGRRKAKAAEPEPQEAASLFDGQLREIMAVAFTVTGQTVCERFDLATPFTNEHGALLADAWIPVLEQMFEEQSPLTRALEATAIVALPFIMEIAIRRAAQKRAEKPAGRQVGIIDAMPERQG